MPMLFMAQFDRPQSFSFGQQLTVIKRIMVEIQAELCRCNQNDICKQDMNRIALNVDMNIYVMEFLDVDVDFILDSWNITVRESKDQYTIFQISSIKIYLHNNKNILEVLKNLVVLTLKVVLVDDAENYNCYASVFAADCAGDVDYDIYYFDSSLAFDFHSNNFQFSQNLY